MPGILFDGWCVIFPIALLLASHLSPALGALLPVTRHTHHVRPSMPALRAYTLSVWPRSIGTTTTTTTAATSRPTTHTTTLTHVTDLLLMRKLTEPSRSYRSVCSKLAHRVVHSHDILRGHTNLDIVHLVEDESTAWRKISDPPLDLFSNFGRRTKR